MSGRKVYLEISIGDQALYEAHLDRFKRTQAFFDKEARKYGVCSESLDTMSDEDKEIFTEGWQNAGMKDEPIFHDPQSLIAGKIVIELNEQQCPKTCENFYALCTGSKGFSKSVRTAKLHYKGAPIHRIVKDFIAQGGDFTRKDGSGGDSIYNGTFADEKNGLKKGLFNQGKGVVAMANSGRNSNTSQFFITLSTDAKKYSKLEGKHVVFGKVIEGMEVLDKLNAVAGEEEVPTQLVWISDCGSVS